MIRRANTDDKTGSTICQTAYAIGKKLGISKNTAKKYIKDVPEDHGLKKRKCPSKLDPYKLQVDTLMSRGIFCNA